MKEEIRIPEEDLYNILHDLAEEKRVLPRRLGALNQCGEVLNQVAHSDPVGLLREIASGQRIDPNIHYQDGAFFIQRGPLDNADAKAVFAVAQCYFG